MSQPPQAMGVLMSFCGGKIYKREIWAISWSLLFSELRLQAFQVSDWNSKQPKIGWIWWWIQWMAPRNSIFDYLDVPFAILIRRWSEHFSREFWAGVPSRTMIEHVFLVTLAAILALNVPLRFHLTAWGSHQRGQHGFGRASASHSLRVGLSSGGPCLNILNVMSTIMTSDNRDMRYAMGWWWLTTQTIFRWIRHVNETWKSDISKKAWDTRPTSIKKCVHPKLHWNDH